VNANAPLATMLCCVLADSATFRFGLPDTKSRTSPRKPNNRNSGNPGLHRNQTPRAFKKLAVVFWPFDSLADCSYRAYPPPELPRARVEHAAGPQRAIPD